MATAWRDFALDPITGDLAIEGGDLVLVQGADAIAQECGIALRLWAGEFPFDVEAGTNWQDVLNLIGITDAEITAEVRRVLMQVTGVASVDSVAVTRDSATRAATLAVQVRADTGAVLTIPAVEIGVGV